MKHPLMTMISGFALVGVGVVGGWFAAAHDHGSEDPAQADAAHESLSSQTLQNLGVAASAAKLGTFMRTQDVQAIVEDAPLNLRPIVIPFGGIVEAVERQPGDLVKRGGMIMRVVRDAFPRPALVLTGDVLTPVSEDLHRVFTELRLAKSRLDIALQELARIKDLNTVAGGEGFPLVSRQKEIEAGYEVIRSEHLLEAARTTLEHHGCTDAEVKKIEDGGHPPRNRDLWRRALAHHGLFGELEIALEKLLPETVRKLPWTVAVIGELAASGLVTESLIEAVRAEDPIRLRFVEVAGLLLRGDTVTHVLALASGGYLDSVMTVRAPTGASDWDLQAINVRVGQRVEAGTTVAVLHNARKMWLRIEAVGEETGYVLDALRNATELSAEPLVRRTGPSLDGLCIDRMLTVSAEGHRGTGAIVVCDNQPVSGGGDKKRTWSLREGLRYVVRIPTVKYEEVFVLTRSAVTESGPDRVIYSYDPEHKDYDKNKVRVLYEDDRTIIVANDGVIKVGDRIVTKGAFALRMALEADAGAAGHGHSH